MLCLGHPRCRRAGPGDRLDLARARHRARGLRPDQRQGDRHLHRLRVPGSHWPGHRQGDPFAALSGRPHQRHDRHLGARGRGRWRESRRAECAGSAHRAPGAGPRPGRRRRDDGADGCEHRRSLQHCAAAFEQQATVVQIACRFTRQFARIGTTLSLATCPAQNATHCSSRSLRFGSMSPRLYARET